MCIDRHHAFIAGQEREEAHALWSQIATDGPRPLAAFDEGWFAHTLAQNDERRTMDDELRPAAPNARPSSLSAQRSALIDWGEAIAVPTLYGRESEIATLHH